MYGAPSLRRVNWNALANTRGPLTSDRSILQYTPPAIDWPNPFKVSREELARCHARRRELERRRV